MSDCFGSRVENHLFRGCTVRFNCLSEGIGNMDIHYTAPHSSQYIWNTTQCFSYRFSTTSERFPGIICLIYSHLQILSDLLGCMFLWRGRMKWSGSSVLYVSLCLVHAGVLALPYGTIAYPAERQSCLLMSVLHLYGPLLFFAETRLMDTGPGAHAGGCQVSQCSAHLHCRHCSLI